MNEIKNKIEIITLGCSKNIVDSERLSRQLSANNFEVTNDTGIAENIIINTCGFIDAAKEESINTILANIVFIDSSFAASINPQDIYNYTSAILVYSL